MTEKQHKDIIALLRAILKEVKLTNRIRFKPIVRAKNFR